jgi:hypothetical protein
VSTLATSIEVSCSYISQQGILFTYWLDTNTFNAALTDNGQQKCAIQNEGFSSGVVVFELSCLGGYSSSFDRDNGVVDYAYGTFSGSFGTTSENYQDGPFGDQYTYWSANVWGC